jgi:hypothetical protein
VMQNVGKKLRNEPELLVPLLGEIRN